MLDTYRILPTGTGRNSIYRPKERGRPPAALSLSPSHFELEL
jgi:hypothetical protein